MRITCEFHYDSAHRLPYVPEGHKCGRLHGHTYVLTVTLEGPVASDGFVIDFGDVKEVVKPLIDRVDHHFLNEIDGLENPTVEVQLPWFWQQIKPSLPYLSELALREGLHNSATYSGEE